MGTDVRLELCRHAEQAIGFGSYRLEGGVASGSPGLRELFGVGPEERFSADDFFGRIHEEDRARVSAQFARALSNVEQPVIDFRIVLTDGSIRHVRESRHTVRDVSGNVVAFQGIVFDVTAERLATTRAEHLAAQHRETQQAAAVGSHVFDLASGRHEWSSEFRRILGIDEDVEPSEEIIAARIHPDDRAKQVAWGMLVVAGEIVDPLVVRLRSDAPPGRVAEFRCRRVLGTDGRDQVMGVVIDVTARAELEAQLRRAAALEAVGTLAAGVAHDFNNQLTVMSLELTRLEATTDYAGVDDLRHALSQSAALTRQLLALAKQPIGERRVVDAVAISRNVTELLRRVCDPSVHVTFEGPEGRIPVRAEEAQLEAALMNLAFNARDAMPDGGELRIVVETTSLDEVVLRGDARPGRYVRISVSDTGVGIAKALEERIFEPYFTTKELGRGTGLGLASVQATARLHDGVVRLESEPEQGSTFHLCLPIPDRSSWPSEPTPRTRPIRTIAGVRILVVEDNAALLALLARELRELGAIVFTADNGAVALVTLDEQPRVDLVLSDLRMPVMDGLELADQLAKRTKSVPLVLMTGYAESAVSAGDVRAASVLLKPFQVEDLVRALADAMPDGAAESVA